MLEIKIKTTDNNLYYFCKYLVKQIRSLLLYNCLKNSKKLFKYDEYIINNKIIKPIIKNTKIPNTKSILIAGTSHLDIHKTLDSYIIKLDRNAIIPTTSAKFIDIIKLVNRGTLDLPKCPIYDKVFDHITNNLISYYNDWVEGGV